MARRWRPIRGRTAAWCAPTTSPRPSRWDGSRRRAGTSATLQFDDGRCDGFVTSVEQFVPGADPAVPMGYWTEQDLPFYYGLARTFPLADRWFCSCLGPTFPNRRFMIAGTAHGLIDDLPWDLVDYPEAGTIFDSADPERDRLGQLPQRELVAADAQAVAGHARPDRRAPPRLDRPAVPVGRARRTGQQVVHRRPVPARAARLRASPAHHAAVLRRRGRGHAAAVQHRGPGLRRLTRRRTRRTSGRARASPARSSST